MSTGRKPWLCEGSPWKTEAAFMNWIRGVLRKGWKVHPIKIEFINRFRKRIKNPNAKSAKRFPECWGMTCDICKVDTVQADIQIDHRGDSGTFTKFSDAEEYMKHLFLIDYDSIRPLCTACHSVVSHAQNTGMTFEQAKIDKQVITLMKDKKKALALLQQFQYNCKNDVQRREALTEILAAHPNILKEK
jgi:hypothetical protein